jgi:hypothetical protein
LAIKKWDYAFGKLFSLSSVSSLKGGAATAAMDGEEAKTDSDSMPFTPALSPFGRGEGVEAAAKMKTCQRHNRAKRPDCVWNQPNPALR